MRGLRKRYLILEIEGENPLPELWSKLERLSPEFDQFILKLIPLKPWFILLRCSHLQVGKLKTLLLSAREGGKTRILGVSGTVKSAERMLTKKLRWLEGESKTSSDGIKYKPPRNK